MIENTKKEYLKELKNIFNEDIEITEDKIRIHIENTLTKRERKTIEFIQNIIDPNDILNPVIDLKTILSQNLVGEELSEYLKKTKLGLSDLGYMLFIQIESKEALELISNYLKALKIDRMIFTQINNFNLVMYYSFYGDLQSDFAKELFDLILMELIIEVRIGISKAHLPIDIHEAYNESKLAIELGNKYKIKDKTYDYEKMMIHQIITNLKPLDKEELNKKIIKANIEMLEPHDIKTANVFLESNLNISEAARKLFIHRNTLIYRLEKINKTTGYDLKVFKDAMEFRILILNFISTM